MNKLLMTMLMTCSLIQTPAWAAGDLSDASGYSVLGSVLVVGGSMSVVAASGHAIVESVEKVGDSVVVLLKDASGATVASVRATGKAAGKLSVAAGTAVKVTACASGYILSVAGEVLAFIPNEAGKALIHSTPSGQ